MIEVFNNLSIMGNNGYVIYNNEDAIIVDFPDKAQRMIEFIEKKELSLKAAFLTHSHYDHITKIEEILIKYPSIHLYLHRDAYNMLSNPEMNLSIYSDAGTISFEIKSHPHTLCFDGDIIEPVHSMFFKCLDVNGHSPDSVAFVSEEEKFIIVGDAIFKDSIGRTDFPFCNHENLITNIKTKILTLGENYSIYPGHGPSTNVGYEKKNNPFLR